MVKTASIGSQSASVLASALILFQTFPVLHTTLLTPHDEIMTGPSARAGS